MLVQKNYRDVPYHNWKHAFSVTHFAYLCLKKFQLVEQGYISNLEALAYFISCLCHDIDHRGINNPFQERCYSVLASLYSSQGSVMERHHVSLAFSILNAENCNFLEPLDRQNYNLCLNLMKDLILATDVATHFKFYKKQYIMTQPVLGKSILRTLAASIVCHQLSWLDVVLIWVVMGMVVMKETVAVVVVVVVVVVMEVGVVEVVLVVMGVGVVLVVLVVMEVGVVVVVLVVVMEVVAAVEVEAVVVVLVVMVVETVEVLVVVSVVVAVNILALT
ncbi:PDEase I domain containing protein [Asbolus verrucosus]|uniref:PDEase I domain containing protein n=1 Tax=Asbolus verrucosus TaxID=1661398 RepID=A0A482V904_ASBVE|nr:PDEase I domain containing protein [Asbolus verrucosus]